MASHDGAEGALSDNEPTGTPAAAKLLDRWAGGAPDSLLTTEATAALKRVRK